ncbi:MAG: hypothetical protein CMJ58_15620 [Planctomycetaceae bacterium]|nr:hypothetical protein [Planctomycetaceae bacterium]
MPNRRISPDRRALYYTGMIITGLGVLSFLSTFVTFLWHFGDFSNFTANARSDGLRALGGIIGIIVGGVLMNVGARGAAGSGLVLDPEQARRDVEPWSRMAGGMASDALDEAGVDLNRLGRDVKDSDLPFDEKLRRLYALYRDGILSREEYDREKQDLLDQN